MQTNYMDTMEALARVRGALQIGNEGTSTIWLNGCRPAEWYAERQIAVFYSRIEKGVPWRDELYEAEALSGYINDEVAPLVNVDATIGSAAWLRAEQPHVSNNLGRIALAFDRAARKGVVDSMRVDGHDLVVRSAAELMVTNAILWQAYPIKEVSRIGVYLSTEEVARLRADYIDFTPAYFAHVVGKAARSRALIPVILDTIRQGGIINNMGADSWLWKILRQLRTEQTNM